MKNQTFVITVLVVAFIIILAIAWYLVSQFKPMIPFPSPQALQNVPSGEESPSVEASIEIPQTNPFGGVKFNPFE